MQRWTLLAVAVLALATMGDAQDKCRQCKEMFQEDQSQCFYMSQTSGKAAEHVFCGTDNPGTLQAVDHCCPRETIDGAIGRCTDNNKCEIMSRCEACAKLGGSSCFYNQQQYNFCGKTLGGTYYCCPSMNNGRQYQCAPQLGQCREVSVRHVGNGDSTTAGIIVPLLLLISICACCMVYRRQRQDQMYGGHMGGVEMHNVQPGMMVGGPGMQPQYGQGYGPGYGQGYGGGYNNQGGGMGAGTAGALGVGGGLLGGMMLADAMHGSHHHDGGGYGGGGGGYGDGGGGMMAADAGVGGGVSGGDMSFGDGGGDGGGDF